MEGDRVNYPDSVADTLRGLLTRMNATAKRAVIGIGARGTISRVLDVPRVPDDELRAVIEGELAHYQILREGTGVFDYVKMDAQDAPSDSAPQVLLMAAEERTTADHREVAARAGLQLVGLEPVTLALYRAAYLPLQAQPSALCLMVNYGKSEIAIVDHGRIRLFRRVDIGADDLVPGRRGTTSAERGAETTEPYRPRTLLGGDEPLFVPPTTPEANSSLNGIVAGNLATEVQRSLDYYQREYPQAPMVTRILLATNDPELDPLADWLSRSLSIDVTPAEPPIALGVSRAIAAQLEGRNGLRYLAAAGLAMKALPDQPDTIPSFNFLTVSRPLGEAGQSKGRLVAASAIGLGTLVAGGLAAMTMLGSVRTQEALLKQSRQRLTTMEQGYKLRADELNRQSENWKVLVREGVALPAFMDIITGSLQSGAGLTEVSISATGALQIAGESATFEAITQTLDRLKLCQYFQNLTLTSLQQKEIQRSKVMEFRFTGQVIGMAAPPKENAGLGMLSQ
jgi:type IV pilus assembly protein PilM